MLRAVLRYLPIDDEDLRLSAEACGRLAVMYRNDAERQSNPLIRGRMEESAAKFERLAERMRGALER